jgi:hypothetical protein
LSLSFLLQSDPSAAAAAATCVDGTSDENGACANSNATTLVTPTAALTASTSALSSSSSVCSILEVTMESYDDDKGDDVSATWVVAGRDLNQGEVISQPDVLVPFRIHNRHTSWPLWRRHHYFWPLQSSDDPRADKDLLVFASGLGSQVSCHDRLHNIQSTAPSSLNHTTAWNNVMNNKPYSTLTSEPLTATRMIARGDPLTIPCRDIE